MRKKIVFESAETGSKLFSLKIKKSQYRQIEELAKTKDQTVEEFVIKAVESYTSSKDY